MNKFPDFTNKVSLPYSQQLVKLEAMGNLGQDHPVVLFHFKKYVLFSTIDYDSKFTMYKTTATCFDLCYGPSSGNILHKTQVCIPQNITCKHANIHEQTVVIYLINITSRSMGENRNMALVIMSS